MLFFLILACLSEMVSPDPWKDCPEERQCLSGDIVINEAKTCCRIGTLCASRSAMEGGSIRGGGSCYPEEEVQRVRKEQEKAQVEQKDDEDLWKDCPVERQCSSSSDGDNKKICCAEDETCSKQDPEKSEVCIKNTETVQEPEKIIADRFEGYNMQGEKSSLPKSCAMCKRIKTSEEVKFLRACKEQRGKAHACDCLTILCSVKVK